MLRAILNDGIPQSEVDPVMISTTLDRSHEAAESLLVLKFYESYSPHQACRHAG